MQRDAVAQVLDAVELLRRGAADHAVHLVALLEQQLGQVGAVLAGDAGDQRARHLRSPTPSRARAATRRSARCPPRRRSAPSSRAAARPSRPTASGARRRPRSVGRCSNSSSAGSLPDASQQMRAISATVSSSEAEMLKSSLRPAADAVAATIPSAMSSTWVSVRVCSPEPKIGSGRSRCSDLRIRSGTAWAMPGSSSGISPGP